MTDQCIFRGRALCIDHNIIWVAKGMVVWGIDQNGNRKTRKYPVGSAIERLISVFRLTRQFLRIGVYHVIPLQNDGLFIVAKKKAYTVNKQGRIISTFSGYCGNKPAHRGVCGTPDGTVFFGEYSRNINREKDTGLYRSTDYCMTFKKIVEFKKTEIRHIHFVQWDAYEQCLWMGTGDHDTECRLMRSPDNGDTWDIVGQGSQLYRALGVSFTEDALYWGTDAGSVVEANFIMKMNRKTRQIEKVQEIQGPCHGNAVLGNGTVYVSTGIEGGKNEKDRFAHIWQSKPDGMFSEVLKKSKDIFPNILQFGVIRFPLGLEQNKLTIYTAFALCSGGEKVYRMERD